MDKLLEIKDLTVSFLAQKKWVQAISDVSFFIKKGETLGIVGESGCGKSVTSMSILHLLPKKTSRIDGGEVLFGGRNLVKLNDVEMSKIRGKEIAMIFQDSMTSLNPVMTNGSQLVEALRVHDKSLSKEDAKNIAIDILAKVGIPSPKKRFKEYPYQLSGGMRQRVMIAMAIIQKPSLLIADEPTTALDVTIQAQILELMKDLKRNLNISIMLITHDMGVVAEMSDRVMVMYAGNVMEVSDTKNLFKNPLHPYSIGLLSSIPRSDVTSEKLTSIEGSVPILQEMPKGCRFCTRCQFATERCINNCPPMIEAEPDRFVRCWKYEN